ncbi:hypothetical protein FA893_07800 [Photobacterium damselae subsp. piscicida]|uniref:hypothetical protein n=1 Tax=Photobacterium damselae TaxID=38293 RepID=UPI0002F3DAB0|nr:hypothetical protein [Photobacterium damselae]OLQ80137.1 hypothetical protein BEI67_14515 [Photobacterium damselae subsp. piscicida]TFZ58296.1 hypothetical protein E4T25_10460 [Photobacterium damselae subsp. piscicida]TJZ93599.1 hypothetical protein FA893_07800 [Photobacterium damselae subsp. piscicida]BBC40958.1 hypothetical protein PDPE_1-01798 [Photobacterium damselae subsp. piscicida]
MQLIKLYKHDSLLEKERRLNQTCPYSASLSSLLIQLAVVSNEPGAKKLSMEKSTYTGNQGLMVD